MRFSKRCQYGIKAVICLADGCRDGYTQSREIAECESLPSKFLESILLALRSASLLESKVGAGGGYRLARPASEILLQSIIDALETSDAQDAASAGPEGQISHGSAALAFIDQRIDGALDQALGTLTIADLLDHSKSALEAAPAG